MEGAQNLWNRSMFFPTPHSLILMKLDWSKRQGRKEISKERDVLCPVEGRMAGSHNLPWQWIVHNTYSMFVVKTFCYWRYQFCYLTVVTLHCFGYPVDSLSLCHTWVIDHFPLEGCGNPQCHAKKKADPEEDLGAREQTLSRQEGGFKLPLLSSFP